MRTLSSLPDDPQKRDQVIESSLATPPPESRGEQSTVERRVETAAATAAAILGSILSTSGNAIIGVASSFDENKLVSPNHATEENHEDAVTERPPVDYPAEDLVPWMPIAPAPNSEAANDEPDDGRP